MEKFITVIEELEELAKRGIITDSSISIDKKEYVYDTKIIDRYKKGSTSNNLHLRKVSEFFSKNIKYKKGNTLITIHLFRHMTEEEAAKIRSFKVEEIKLQEKYNIAQE